MQNLRVNDWSKLAMSQDWYQVHVIRRISEGGIMHLLFFLSSNISLEIYAKFEGQ